MPALKTVSDYIKHLQTFDPDWRVVVSTGAGGGISVEHRETKEGEPIIAIFGSNGGSFGYSPLTEEKYIKESQRFLSEIQSKDRRYTSRHGDHRIYTERYNVNDSCYGLSFDHRVIERMVIEGLANVSDLDLKRVNPSYKDTTPI